MSNFTVLFSGSILFRVATERSHNEGWSLIVVLVISDPVMLRLMGGDQTPTQCRMVSHCSAYYFRPGHFKADG